MLMELPGNPAVGTRLGVAMLTLRNEDAKTLLDGIAANRLSRALLAWLPLLRGSSEPGIIQLWRLLAESEPDAKIRADLGSLVKNWLRLLAEPIPLAWEQGLKGYNMIESPFMNELRQEGRQEGRIETQRGNLFKLAQVRFHTAVPADLAAIINATSNMVDLDRWLEVVVTSNSLDEFRSAVGH